MRKALPIIATFAVHEVLSPYRCSQAKWDSGTLTVANEYLGIDPVNYGAGGAVNGTGQVGVAVPLQNDTLVTLTSSNTSLIQVPPQVTINAGTRDSDFTVASTVPISNLIPTTVTVVATFPDGNTSTVTLNITYYPPPPTDSSTFYPCGSDGHDCLWPSKPGTCWWDRKGADWFNIHCAEPRQTEVLALPFIA